MVSNGQAVVLGILQGLTEFLPVSSSGHLVLGQHLLGLKEPEMLFDVAVHMGTLIAVAAFFWRQLWTMLRGLWARDEDGERGRRLILLVFMGSLPTAAMGLLFRHDFESLFGSVTAVGVALIVTGALLMATHFAPPARRDIWRMGVWRALVIGLVQGIAITPGISRSGSTISAALLLGVDRRLAAEFSFVLSLPAILGALLLHVKDLGPEQAVAWPPLAIGAVAAGVTGILALKLLIGVVQRGGLHWFAFYCWLLGAVSLIWA